MTKQQQDRLRWTTQRPTQPGFYWVELVACDETIQMIGECVRYGCFLRVQCGDREYAMTDECLLRWSDSRIPLPEE